MRCSGTHLSSSRSRRAAAAAKLAPALAPPTESDVMPKSVVLAWTHRMAATNVVKGDWVPHSFNGQSVIYADDCCGCPVNQLPGCPVRLVRVQVPNWNAPPCIQTKACPELSACSSGV